MTAIGFAIRSLGPSPWEELLRAAISAAGWSDETPVTVYRETLEACTLRPSKPADLDSQEPERGWAMRVFDEDAEARFEALEDGVRAWVTVEDGGTPVLHEDLTYYLHGERRADDDFFSEGRFGGAEFRYPVSDTRRAYIVVREYRSPEPDDWAAEDDEAAEGILNRPRVLAHRFLAVGGKG